MLRKYLIFFAFTTIVHGASPIIESNDINSVLHHVYDTHNHTNVLVVFDIDNTLCKAKDNFHTDPLFTSKLTEFKKAGYKESVAWEKAYYFYTKQPTVLLDPVQPCTPHLISFLQTIGIPTCAITNRQADPQVITHTLTQLSHIGINFMHRPLHASSLDLAADVHYRSGIVFNGANNKGASLIKLFTTINYVPHKVVFLDDKRRHVESVVQALQQASISCVGIRYSHLDNTLQQANRIDDLQDGGTDRVNQFEQNAA